MGKLLNYYETALYLGVAVSTLRRWVMQRKIPHVKLGRSLRFEEGSLRTWVEKRSVAED